MLTEKELQQIKDEAEKYSSSQNVMGERSTYLYKGYIAALTKEREKTKGLVENIQHHIHMWGDEPERAIRLMQKEITNYQNNLTP